MVSTPLSARFTSLRAAEPLVYRSLRFVPLLGESSAEPEYRLLGEQSEEYVRVGEVNNEGRVSDVEVENLTELRVLLVDGQELLGAKQHRVLNTDVLVPAGTTLVVPVSCVEAGRWGWSGAKEFGFGSSSTPSTRARSSRRVYESLKEGSGHRSDQQEVWDEVHALHRKLGLQSRTGALSDAYESRRSELDEVRASLRLPAGTVGFAVYADDRFVGLEVFDRETTLADAWDRLTDGYVLDWLASRSTTATAGEDEHDDALEHLLEHLPRLSWEQFDSPGEGTDLRLDDDGLVGSALVWEDRVALHAHVFRRYERPTPPIVPESSVATRAAAARAARSTGRTGPPLDRYQGDPANVGCAECGFMYATVRTADGVVGCNHCGKEAD